MVPDGARSHQGEGRAIEDARIGEEERKRSPADRYQVVVTFVVGSLPAWSTARQQYQAATVRNGR